MLKQSMIRNTTNHRGRSLKVKDALWMFVLLVLCIWFLCQLKQQAYSKNGAAGGQERQNGVSGRGEIEHGMLKMGRKDLKLRVIQEMEKNDNQEGDAEDEESKTMAMEEDGGVDQEEEIELEDKERIEEAEHDQLQDLIEEGERVDG